jgi:two-component system, cell cycle response regulator DivK
MLSRVSSKGPVTAPVLVVDDDEDIREIYAESLVLNGFQVLHACDGQEALAIAFMQGVAAVVMDLDMPVMDGLTATHALKCDARTTQVPVVVVTGSARAEELERARLAGCDALLSKPCPPDVVILVIQHILRGEPSPRRFSAFQD